MESLKKCVSFVVFCLLQVLILNQIHLFGCITPLFYVYFIMSFERSCPRWVLLLWSFFMGVVLDTFTNTPGVTAASLTMLGFLQPVLIEPFAPRDSSEDFVPTIGSLGSIRYFYYATIMVLIYHMLFYMLEMFSFFNILYWLESVIGSTVLTLILILLVENVRRDK